MKYTEYYNLKNKNETYLKCVKNEGTESWPRFSNYNIKEELEKAHLEYEAISDEDKKSYDNILLNNLEFPIDLDHDQESLNQFISLNEQDDDVIMCNVDGVGHTISLINLKYTTSPYKIKGVDFEVIDQFGGEGEGDQYWFVAEVKTPDGVTSFWQFSGYYASYDGGYIDNVCQVYPKEVTITQWNENKKLNILKNN